MTATHHHVHRAIIAIAGPRALTAGMKAELGGMFDRVHIFETPDDFGNFPDTSGYERDDWEDIVERREDGNLWDYMTKCMDAALQFALDNEKALDKFGYRNIETSVNWPKFGGRIFAVTGHVTGTMPAVKYVRQ